MAIVFGVAIGILGQAYRGLAELVGAWSLSFVAGVHIIIKPHEIVDLPRAVA
jgi:hypothetical protein